MTVQVGDWHLGVRFSSQETAALVRERLRTHLRPAIDAPANYSLHEGEPLAHGGVKPFHTLYRAETPVSRSPSTHRLIDELVAHLATHTFARRTDLLVVDAVAIAKEGRLALFPPRLRKLAVAQQRMITRLGLELHTPVLHLVDPRTGELVVEESALEQSASRMGGAAHEAPLAPGRYPIATWFVRGSAAPGASVRPADAVLRMFGLVDNRPALGDQDSLDLVVRMARKVPAATSPHRPEEIGQLALRALG